MQNVTSLSILIFIQWRKKNMNHTYEYYKHSNHIEEKKINIYINIRIEPNILL